MSKATIDRLAPSIRAKSSGVSLRSHLALTGQVAYALLCAAGLPGISPVLVTAAALHDIGKQRDEFQRYLDQLGGWRCHEDDAPVAIQEFLSDQASREWLRSVSDGELPIPESDPEVQGIIGLAVTHHGRRLYLPEDGCSVRPLRVEARAKAAPTSTALTEFDLLYRYQPYGGVVILADQIASALQGGRSGVLISANPSHSSLANPAGDLLDERDAPATEVSAEEQPWGTGLQRLLLDGLGFERIEALPEATAWRMLIDSRKSVVVRSDL